SRRRAACARHGPRARCRLPRAARTRPGAGPGDRRGPSARRRPAGQHPVDRQRGRAHRDGFHRVRYARSPGGGSPRAAALTGHPVPADTEPTHPVPAGPGRTAMFRTMLKSKIHRATVTHADLHYVGSVTVDAELMKAADLYEGEQVAIVDVTNGARLETYVITGEPGTGVIGINGAAAHLIDPGDIVILISYAMMD